MCVLLHSDCIDCRRFCKCSMPNDPKQIAAKRPIWLSVANFPVQSLPGRLIMLEKGRYIYPERSFDARFSNKVCYQ